MSPAIEAFKQHITEVATLGSQVNQINARISQIQGIANDAVAPIQHAAELKAKRRSILARLFLGTGDKSELPETESAIAAAEKAAEAKAPTREGAEAAIEELQRQASAISSQIHEIHRDHNTLRHAALIEYAKDAIPAYQEAAENLAKAYAELLGRCRAADDMSLYGNGIYPVSFGFPLNLCVPDVPTFGAYRYKTLIDKEVEIGQAKEEAIRHMDGIARAVASTTNDRSIT